MAYILFHPSANNERGPKYLEPLLSSLIARNRRDFFSLGIRSRKGQTEYLIQAPKSQLREIAAQLQDTFPGCATSIVTDPSQDRKREVWICPLRLSPDVFPIKVHSDFVEKSSQTQVDPLEPVHELFRTGKSGNVETTCWVHGRLARSRRVHRACKQALVHTGQFRFDFIRRWHEKHSSSTGWHSSLINRLIGLGIQCPVMEPGQFPKLDSLLAECVLELEVRALHNAKSIARSKQRSLAAALEGLTDHRQHFYLVNPYKVRSRTVHSRSKHQFLLSPAELASLWHPPNANSNLSRITMSAFRELEPPQNLPSKEKDREVVTLGRVKFRSERRTFGMDLDARRRHLYIIGKTGMGKTTLLQNILIDDIRSDRGVAVFDPHGDLANSILDSIPKRRTNDVVLIDPSDDQYAVSFNPLQVHAGIDKTLVADGVLTAFQKVFGFDESQAPRMIHIFRNCLLSLVELPEVCLLDVQRLLIDSSYRNSVIGHVSNPVVRQFWIGEFGKWKPGDRTAFVASLQNKLGAFTTNEKLQRILGQRKGKLNLRRIMDEQKVLIVNLSKGAIGENASNLLGTLLVTCLQQAAMSRANIPEHKRRDYSIIIDEFQNYATPSIAVFLSEARKYRSHLILSHQYTSQLPEEILDAILGNCGSMLAFQIGASDADLFSKQLGGQIEAIDLMNVPKFHAYCRIMAEGVLSNPFTIQTCRPTLLVSDNPTTIRDESNRRFAFPIKQHGNAPKVL